MTGFEQYGFFVLKLIAIVIAILLVWFFLLAISSRAKRAMRQGYLEVSSLHHEFQHKQRMLEAELFDKKACKQKRKAAKKDHKRVKKELKKDDCKQKPKLFVLDFEGDMTASGVEGLRREVDAVLQVANPKKDSVLLRLESPGGTVPGYGLAASQLDRLRQAGVHLTASVDKVAASGGYMMACVAHDIIAAPFAIIGSIGVIYQLPNLYKFLDKQGVKFEQVKAGEHKRTLTMFGKNTEADRKQVQSEIDETHVLFKGFVQKHRPVVDIEQVATGRYWFAEQAFELRLVDQLQTSDDYLMQRYRDEKTDVFHIKWKTHKTLRQKFSQAARAMLMGI